MKKYIHFYSLFFSILSFHKQNTIIFLLLKDQNGVYENANTFVLSSNGLLANSIFSDKIKLFTIIHHYL